MSAENFNGEEEKDLWGNPDEEEKVDGAEEKLDDEDKGDAYEPDDTQM